MPWYADYYPQDYTLVNQVIGWFYSIDTNRNGTLDQGELARALEQAGMRVEPVTIGKLMQTFDLDGNNSISINEFICMYKYLLDIKNSFTSHDRDRSGYLEYNEVMRALSQTGRNISLQTGTSLMKKYDPTGSGRISLEGYINLCMCLASIRSFYEKTLNKQHKGKKNKGKTIELTLNDLMDAAPYFN